MTTLRLAYYSPHNILCALSESISVICLARLYYRRQLVLLQLATAALCSPPHITVCLGQVDLTESGAAIFSNFLFGVAALEVPPPTTTTPPQDSGGPYGGRRRRTRRCTRRSKTSEDTGPSRRLPPPLSTASPPPCRRLALPPCQHRPRSFFAATSAMALPPLACKALPPLACRALQTLVAGWLARGDAGHPGSLAAGWLGGWWLVAGGWRGAGWVGGRGGGAGCRRASRGRTGTRRPSPRSAPPSETRT